METNKQDVTLGPWKHYLTLTAESLISFYLATFCLALFFKLQGKEWLIASILMIVAYGFVIFVCAKRIAKQLPIAMFMLMIPLIPLVALMIIISMIPIIQQF